MANFIDLIHLLADGNFHSGEELGEALGMTRSGVWKQIKQLAEMGIVIDSLHGKGYRIAGGLELLDNDLICRQLSPTNREQLAVVELLEAIDSTNKHLLGQLENSNSKPKVCIAEQQSAGRGRRGRHWFTPFGQSIPLSLAWNFHRDPSVLAGLSLATAVAVVRSLIRYGVRDGIGLKWPNDVLWQGRKLAGILLEFVGESNGFSTVIIGVGLNVSIPSALDAYIDQPWVDVKTIMGKRVERNRLAGILIDELMLMLSQFEQYGLPHFLEEWQQLDVFAGKNVQLETHAGRIQGNASGIGEQGELILTDNQGKTQRYYSGEIQGLRPT